jgi:hypothetical protein
VGTAAAVALLLSETELMITSAGRMSYADKHPAMAFWNARLEFDAALKELAVTLNSV